jgi:hypothetical protein
MTIPRRAVDRVPEADVARKSWFRQSRRIRPLPEGGKTNAFRSIRPAALPIRVTSEIGRKSRNFRPHTDSGETPCTTNDFQVCQFPDRYLRSWDGRGLFYVITGLLKALEGV